MKHSPIHILFRSLITIIILLSIIFAFQITYADTISFGNDAIDNFFHFTEATVFLSIIVLSFITLAITIKTNWIVYSCIALSVLSSIMLAIAILFSSVVVFSSERTNERMYFAEKDGYKYYVKSERFVAFEGSPEISFYKEKPLFSFIKERFRVNDEEFSILGVNKSDIASRFEIYHFR